MRTLLLTAALLGLAGPAAAQNETAYFSDIGYTALQARLGAATPTGAGVAVSQIEALESANAYRPNEAEFPGKAFTYPSGGGVVSGHASYVGRYFYGGFSIAPGITTVNSYKVTADLSAGDWYGPAYLNVDQADAGGRSIAPLSTAARVQNFSFVSNDTDYNNPLYLKGLRRLDFAVRRDNFVAVVAVNNQDSRVPGSDKIPALLANGYNSIAVGTTAGVGLSSYGPTTGDTVGRSKPDIVVPRGDTSSATPVVSAAAALLLNVADAKPVAERANAGRAETIKAVLLSGATTQEFAGLAQPWHRDAVTVGGKTFVRPLDARFGAGELNVDNSHRILSSAQAVGTGLTVNGQYGWDYQTVTASDAVRRYYLDVPTAGVTAADLTATATWLRRVALNPDPTLVSSATLSELRLRVYQSDATFTLGALVDESVSPIDNVQHTYTTGLTPGGRYAVEVSLANLPVGQTSEDFAVAWALVPVPEPAGVLAVAAVVVVGSVRRLRGGSENRR